MKGSSRQPKKGASAPHKHKTPFKAKLFRLSVKFFEFLLIILKVVGEVVKLFNKRG